MKVLILSTMYPNSKVYQSGVFVHQQVKELFNLGVDVTVAAPVPYSPKWLPFLNKKRKLFREIPYVENIDGIEVIHSRYLAIPRGIFKQYWAFIYIYQLNRLLDKFNIKTDFDLIHAHGALPDNHAALLQSKRYGIPFIITVHGETIYSMLNYKNRFKISKFVLNKADAVIAVSSKVAERIKKYIGRSKNIHVILNGFNPRKETSNSICNDSKIKILFVATLIERKGCEYLLRAFKKIYEKHLDSELTIAGGGELLNKMKALSKNLDISERTTFTEHLNHDQVLEQMTKCDIFVMPSWDEAFGVVYLEAMSLKKPVIGTFNEGISEIITDGENGFLVRTKDVDELATKLSILIEDKKLRINFGLRGYEKIKNLTWQNSAKQVLKLYQQII